MYFSQEDEERNYIPLEKRGFLSREEMEKFGNIGDGAEKQTKLRGDLELLCFAWGDARNRTLVVGAHRSKSMSGI